MNYELKLKKHCQDLASAFAQEINPNSYAEIIDDTQLSELHLAIHEDNNSTVICTYPYGRVEIIKEGDTPDKNIRIIAETKALSLYVEFLEKIPAKFLPLKQSSALVAAFYQYCRTTAANYCLENTDFEVVGKEATIFRYKKLLSKSNDFMAVMVSSENAEICYNVIIKNLGGFKIDYK